MRGRWSTTALLVLGSLWMVAAAPSHVIACAGDCDSDRAVSVDELVVGVNIALGTASVTRCTAFDADGDGQVTVNELVRAVGAALDGCPPDAGTPTPTPEPTCVANDGTASITVTGARPPSGNGAFAVSCVTVDGGDPERPELTRISIVGRVGTERAELLVQFVTATSAVDTVTYQWGQSPSVPGRLLSLAFCGGAGCSGATVDREARSATLAATRLEGPVGEMALIDGTVNWRGD